MHSGKIPMIQSSHVSTGLYLYYVRHIEISCLYLCRVIINIFLFSSRSKNHPYFHWKKSSSFWMVGLRSSPQLLGWSHHGPGVVPALWWAPHGGAVLGAAGRVGGSHSPWQKELPHLPVCLMALFLSRVRGVDSRTLKARRGRACGRAQSSLSPGEPVMQTPPPPSATCPCGVGGFPILGKRGAT